MTYRLVFEKRAKKEWDKLAYDIRNQFTKKLAERLEKPDIPKAKLAGMRDCYKIKLRVSGYRLVYRIIKEEIIIEIITVGIRAKEKIYNIAKNRLNE